MHGRLAGVCPSAENYPDMSALMEGGLANRENYSLQPRHSHRGAARFTESWQGF